MSGISLSQAAANLLRAMGREIDALKEDYVGGRIELPEFERRLATALSALRNETEPAE